MEKLLAHGVPTCSRALRHLTIRLAAHPDTRNFAVQSERVRRELLAADDALEEAQERRVAQSALIGYLDGQVGAVVAEVQRALWVQVAGRREDPLYQRAFPRPPSRMLRSIAGAEQTRFVRALLDLLRTDPRLAGLAGTADRLQAAQEALQAAVTEREALFVPEARARAQRESALTEARRFYNTMHARLSLIFPDDPSWVDSFFARLRRRRAPRDEAASAAGGSELESA